LTEHLAAAESWRVGSRLQLKQRIRRERALVARGRRPYALLVFDVGDAAQDRRAGRELVLALCRRLRFGDEVGLLLHGRVGVMLPVTDRRGAQAVAADVHRIVARTGIHLSMRLGGREGNVQSEGAGASNSVTGRAPGSDFRDYPSRADALRALGPKEFIRAAVAEARKHGSTRSA
jgi:hypothetical protein